MEQDAGTFGSLLRRYRVEAGLSQEVLAERAGLSLDAVSVLERGLRQTPRRETVQLLAAALDLGAAERMALEARVLRRRGPVAAPASQATPSAALPRYLTGLIGRERDEAAVVHLLQRSAEAVRLLTLTGPAGVGKTRLAVQVAETMQEHFAAGVVFVPLASLAGPGLVMTAIAQALGVHEERRQSLLQSVLAAMQAQQLLLVLDTFEHVAAAAPVVAELLAACPQVRVLTTSRAPLQLHGEQLFPLSPLPLPLSDPHHIPPLDVLAQAPAVALFLQRARAVRPDFTLTMANAATVVAVCQRLDGLPLAIELAAARIGYLPLPLLLTRLEHSLQVLTGGARDLPLRQQSLRAALTWSHELLDAHEQALFRRLGIFAGGCTLEAAEAVGPSGAAHAGDVFAGLGALVAKGLLRMEELSAHTDPDGGTRFSMLDTIREYALERLEVSGEQAQVRRAHLEYYVRLAAAAEPALAGPAQQWWLARLEAEHDNLRAALHWARESEGAVVGLHLAVELIWFWAIRGYYSEGEEWLETLLSLTAQIDQPDVASAQARACYGLGFFAFERGHGDDARATVLAEQSLALFKELGDAAGECDALWLMGEVAQSQRDLGRAAALFEASLTLARERGDSARSANALVNLGQVAHEQGDYAQAVALIEDGLTLFQRLGDTKNIAFAHVSLGHVARAQGDHAHAAVLARVGLALFQDMGDKKQMAHTLALLGELAQDQGDYAQAVPLHYASLRLFQEMGAASRVASGLEAIAAATGAGGQPERAARLCGAATSLREAISVPLPPAHRAEYDHTVATARAALGAEAFMAAFAAGQALPLEQAMMAALRPEQ